MIQRYGHGRAAPRVLRDGVREFERNEERRAARRALTRRWLKYTAPRYGDDICSMCGAPLPSGTAYMHCARCLATRGIDESTLRSACARALEGDWPFQQRRLDGRRWAHTLIAFWRNHVDPMESRTVPYRTSTLESAFYFVERHLSESGVATLWKAPPESESGLDPAMVVHAHGETLTIGVGTQRRIATLEDGPRAAHVASFDEFLQLAGEQEGYLVVEKLSRRARRDAPIAEILTPTAGGRRVMQLRCQQEERGWLAPRLSE